MQRSEVFEQNLVARLLGHTEIYLIDFQQREIAFAFLGRANFSGDRIAGTQVETPDLTGRYVDIVRPGQVGAVRGAQKSEAVLEDFQHAAAEYVFAFFRARLENRENYVLFSRTGNVVDAHFLRCFDEFRCWLSLEFAEVHKITG